MRWIMPILVLATMSGCSLTDLVVEHSNEAKVVKAKTDIGTLSMASEMFRLDHGRYPQSLDELLDPPGEHDYLERTPMDPWSKAPYVMKVIDGKPAFGSYGADGVEGGEGLDADLWETGSR